METLEGRVLLASSELLDPNFVHTVVLLIEHSEMGALGLVLNRPTTKTVQELWHQVGEASCDSREPVHLGGPVSGPLMAIHSYADLAEIEVLAGVFFAAKKHNLDELVRKVGDFKLFIGHAGWGPGQLENEIEQGGWRIVTPTSGDVFDSSDGLWQRLSLRAERSRLPAMLGIKHIPPDPSLN